MTKKAKTMALCGKEELEFKKVLLGFLLKIKPIYNLFKPASPFMAKIYNKT